MKPTLVATEIGPGYTHPYLSNTTHSLRIFDKHRQVLVADREVILLHGSCVARKLVYESSIVAATYTTFPHPSVSTSSASKSDVKKSIEAFVVCLSKQAHVYYDDGRQNVVSFSFPISMAFPFDSGLILERDSLSDVSGIPASDARFLALIDPIHELKVLGTAAIATIPLHEHLVCFPPQNLNKSMSLCATYNKVDRCVNVYFIKAGTRLSIQRAASHPKNSRRKPSLFPKNPNVNSQPNPNPSGVLEDDLPYDAVSAYPIAQNAASLSMDKKRTSTLLSDASSMARMANDIEPPIFQPSREYPPARKDMLLSRIELIDCSSKMSLIRVFNLAFDGKEAIVVCDTGRKTCRAFIYPQGTTTKSQTSYTIACAECVPMFHPGCAGHLLALQADGTILMANPFVDVTSPPISVQVGLPNDSARIRHLIDCRDNLAAVTDTNGASHLIKLVLEPHSDFVMACLRCLKYLSGSKVTETVWMVWRVALMLDPDRDEWDAFVATILVLAYPFQEPSKCLANPITRLLPRAKILQKESNFNYSFQELSPYIALALHLLREEYKLNVTEALSVDRLGMLLTQLTMWMGWPEQWTRYYMYDPKTIDLKLRLLQGLVVPDPPNLLKSLASLFGLQVVRYITYSQLVEEGEPVDIEITPRTHFILKAFEVLVLPSYGSSALVHLFSEYKVYLNDLELYPPGICMPLKDAILKCQENPDFEWTRDALDLVGRQDLLALFSPPADHCGVLDTASHQKSVTQVLHNVLDPNECIEAWDGQLEADRIEITKLIFDYDRRYYEITTLLHQTKQQVATLQNGEDLAEYDLVVARRELASLVALRTLTIPFGRAALYYAARKPLLTEKFPVPKFNLNTCVAPTMTNIVLAPDAIPSIVTEWGYFHNGVAAGLSICKNTKGVTGSWIIFNKPGELSAQHAGFLLGLGLNGYLKNLEEWHIYNYLGPKHPLTSVGLLIGMAASLRGTMDNKLTKVLSVHAVALLPQGASDLNVPIMVQTAGLVGIGLLYLESQHRRMSEILLLQISGSIVQNGVEHIFEGYRLAAGFALGYVNLGKGNDLGTLRDTHLVDKLLMLAVSVKDQQQQPGQELEKSASGAIVALMLIFLKTENLNMAEKMAVPQLEHLMDYVRPDLLLLRSLAKNLCMWLGIKGTVAWVESEIPRHLRERHLHSQLRVLSSDQVPYLNLVGGLCLAIAVKHALSQDAGARDTLLHFFDELTATCDLRAESYDQKLASHCARHMRILVGLCLSLAMSGLGDLKVFRRVRALYCGTTPDIGYGNYMAINTSLGFLFLGGGQYAFGSSNLAIAGLVTSLYPIYPKEVLQGHDVHLQSLRHFWALLVEPRCLVVRSVNTRRPCKLPVSITLKSGRVMEKLSPCLLPSLDEIAEISTLSRDYFTVRVLLHKGSEHAAAFMRSLTIHVSPRNDHAVLEQLLALLLGQEKRELDQAGTACDYRKLLELESMQQLLGRERHVLREMDSGEGEQEGGASRGREGGLELHGVIDDRLAMMQMVQAPRTVEEVWNLRLLFAYSDQKMQKEQQYLSVEFVEQLKQVVRRHLGAAGGYS